MISLSASAIRALSLRRCALHVALAFTSLSGIDAYAADAQGTDASAAGATGETQAAEQPQTIWTRDTLLGDMGGIRPWLGKYGVTFNLMETSEYLANLRGGLKRGGTYDGVTTMSLGVDTEKAFGLKGGSFNVSALQIHGKHLSENNLGTLNTASGIEAKNSTRLWELWYQQSLLNDRIDIKIGQQSIDQEFMVSQYSNTFIGTMFGWPAVPSLDMPNGGPAYPLSALGARVRARLTPSLTAMAGVFDGDPLGNDSNNYSGTNFNLHNGALYIGELQYAINQPSESDSTPGGAANKSGLPGTYKLGVWYNTGRFADQRFDSAGQPFTVSGDDPRQHHGNYSIYAVADQMVWRPDPNGPRSLGVFARVMGAPNDRNLINFSANLGVVMHAPFKGRDNDSIGLGLAYVKVSNRARAFDIDNGYVPRGSETALEATYQYQVTPWWQIQGDMQYTFNAGAGQNPNNQTQALRNTFVVGVRTNITF